jgi:hypothetical protein
MTYESCSEGAITFVFAYLFTVLTILISTRKPILRLFIFRQLVMATFGLLTSAIFLNRVTHLVVTADVRLGSSAAILFSAIAAALTGAAMHSLFVTALSCSRRMKPKCTGPQLFHSLGVTYSYLVGGAIIFAVFLDNLYQCTIPNKGYLSALAIVIMTLGGWLEESYSAIPASILLMLGASRGLLLLTRPTFALTDYLGLAASALACFLYAIHALYVGPRTRRSVNLLDSPADWCQRNRD